MYIKANLTPYQPASTLLRLSISLGSTSTYSPNPPLFMPLPPGPDFLVKNVLPKALGPPLLVYGILRFTHYQTYGTAWSSNGSSGSFWSFIVTLSISSLFIHPTIWILSDLYSRFRQKRDAAARGAILPPLIRESSFQIIKAQKNSALNGYMGM
jgi:hypothetical protein